LRNAEVTRISPVDPPLVDVLPLTPGLPPMGDLYEPVFRSGDLDPDRNILFNDRMPLVFYGIDGPGTLQLSKTPDRRLRISF
jgi:hypothetical protein